MYIIDNYKQINYIRLLFGYRWINFDGKELTLFLKKQSKFSNSYIFPL